MTHRIWILNQPTERGYSGVFEASGTEVIVVCSRDRYAMVPPLPARQVTVATPDKFGYPSNDSFVCAFNNLTLRS